MDFETFAARARELAAAYPEPFMEGIEIVDVHRDARHHPHLEDVYTLGECETSPLSDPTGQEPFRSRVHLYYGSFVALAGRDPSFDVEAELEETLAHEIQHHLEDRAGLPTLRDEDALFEAHARFRAGLDAPAGWYRFGDPIEPGLWAVDLDLFLELPLRRPEWEALRGTRLVLTLLDGTLEVDVPGDADPEEVWTFEEEGLEDETGGPVGDLHVIPLVR
jgi:hypothetical protein